jgi:RimJ/RimL family protein N-acetyltransferase
LFSLGSGRSRLAAWLRDAGVVLVGIDSHNIDCTDGGDRPVHSMLLGSDIPIVEHLCGLEHVPDGGAHFFAVPPKVRGMGSFPVRAFASDPLIWEQHPDRDRYQRAVFNRYFQSAMESRGALLIMDNDSGRVIGSSRYYEHDETKQSIAIGYTFISREFWGRGYNRALKTLMLDHAFRFAQHVQFYVGINNVRSRTAMLKLGGRLIGEVAVSYTGEPSHPNVIYQIDKDEWIHRADH